MNFTVSTKPLTDALELGVINASVSKFYQKSCLAQVRADRRLLTINLEASFVCTQLELRGSGDSDEPANIFVDNVLFKQLMGTIETATVTLEFDEGGLIIHSGKSKFTLPKVIDGVDIDLNRPAEITGQSTTIDIKLDDWKFIENHQMFAIAMSFITPVYTRVWMGQFGDVIVGDFDNSIFTHSKKSKLGRTCLLSDTIINLFNSLPEGAKLTQADDSYIISLITDGYTYTAQFKTQSEEDDGVGSYNADVILGTMVKDEAAAVSVNVEAITKILKQADLLSTSAEDIIELRVHDSEVSLVDRNIDGDIPIEGVSPISYAVKFKTVNLKSVINNLDADTVKIAPMKQEVDDGEVIVGVCIWSPEMEVIIGGVED